MKQKSPKHRKQTRRIVARKAAHRKVPKAIDLNQLSERLARLRFSLQKAIDDALIRTRIRLRISQLSLSASHRKKDVQNVLFRFC